MKKSILREHIQAERAFRNWSRKWWGIIGMVLLLFVVVACDGPDAPTVNNDDAILAGNELRPVEEEQIENVVTAYFQRDSATPPYVVNIEQVEDAWARVSMRPEGVENSDDVILYLQKQSATAIEAPTIEPDTATGNIGPVDTTSGWTIILGPQAQFSEEELDNAGIPPFIRSS